MYTSIALAKIIGLYCVLVGLAMLLKPERCKKMVQDYIQFPAVLDVAGIFTLILGLIMIVIHNVWVMGLAGISNSGSVAGSHKGRYRLIYA